MLLEHPDIIDDVNALLKLGVGDMYRLEHIKQSYMDNKTIWITDSNYLDKLREKYLVQHNTATLHTESEDRDQEKGIHCWKCGKKTPLHANFCMACGSSIFEVGAGGKKAKKEPRQRPRMPRRLPSRKTMIIIGIPVLALIILGGAYAGYVGSDRSSPAVPAPPPEPASRQTSALDDSNSACGPGTIYDSATNTCVLP